jgi:hypothetical protein
MTTNPSLDPGLQRSQRVRMPAAFSPLPSLPPAYCWLTDTASDTVRGYLSPGSLFGPRLWKSPTCLASLGDWRASRKLLRPGRSVRWHPTAFPHPTPVAMCRRTPGATRSQDSETPFHNPRGQSRKAGGRPGMVSVALKRTKSLGSQSFKPRMGVWRCCPGKKNDPAQRLA